MIIVICELCDLCTYGYKTGKAMTCRFHRVRFQMKLYTAVYKSRNVQKAQ